MKPFNSLRKSVLLFLILFYSNFLFSQKINEQIEIKLENDQSVGLDRYYTSGIFISYKRSIENSFLFKKDDTNKIQLSYTLGNEIYTPSNLSSFDVNTFDRPYAGWLFGRFEISRFKKRSASSVALELGVTGKESLSGDFQLWFHRVIGIDVLITWEEQIAFRRLFNLKYKYLHEWNLNAKNVVQYEIHSSIGTKDIFLDNSFNYFFGKFNSLDNSSRIGAVDTTNKKEIYGLISIGYKYVAHNTLIEGGLFKDDILFTTDITKHIAKFKTGVIYKSRRNAYKLIFNYNSRETPLSSSHAYLTFSFSRNF